MERAHPELGVVRVSARCDPELKPNLNCKGFIQEMGDARYMITASLGETAQIELISCLLASIEPDHVTGASINTDIDKFSSV